MEKKFFLFLEGINCAGGDRITWGNAFIFSLEKKSNEYPVRRWWKR